MASRSKSRSRASASKKSKSPAKKTPAKKRAPSKSPARTKTPASAPPSRGRSRSVSRKPTKEETKATPKRAPSKTRVASRSSSRSRASVKTPVVKEPVAKLIKKTPAQATPSASVSSSRSRTFERAEDSVARTLRSLTQSRERPQSATPAVTTKCCANIRGLPASICRNVCALSSNVQTRAKNTNKYLKRRFGVWYGETVALIIVFGILAVAVNQILQNDPAKLRLFITHNINKAITKTTNAFNQVKDAIQSKPN